MDVVRVCRKCKVREIPFDQEYDLCPDCIRKQQKSYTIMGIVFGVLIAVFALLIISPLDLLPFNAVDDLAMLFPLLISIGGEIYTAIRKNRMPDLSDL